jgi:hypothetical protein
MPDLEVDRVRDAEFQHQAAPYWFRHPIATEDVAWITWSAADVEAFFTVRPSYYDAQLRTVDDDSDDTGSDSR